MHARVLARFCARRRKCSDRRSARRRCASCLRCHFVLGAALAGLAGALAAPIYQVTPLMGSDILLVVFAIIVIGGMGSIGGTIVSSYALRADREASTQALVPQAASFIVFAFMCVVLLLRPQGLFGISVVRSHGNSWRPGCRGLSPSDTETAARRPDRHGAGARRCRRAITALPMLLYPVYLMKIFCFAIFAASFNFLLGFAGIMSFGQAACSAPRPISPRMRLE